MGLGAGDFHGSYHRGNERLDGLDPENTRLCPRGAGSRDLGAARWSGDFREGFAGSGFTGCARSGTTRGFGPARI